MRHPTALTYTGPRSAPSASTIVMTAVLTASGLPAAGQRVTFTFNKKRFDAITNSSGVAVVQAAAPSRTGTYTVDLTYAATTTNTAASTSATITVT